MKTAVHLYATVIISGIVVIGLIIMLIKSNQLINAGHDMADVGADYSETTATTLDQVHQNQQAITVSVKKVAPVIDANTGAIPACNIYDYISINGTKCQKDGSGTADVALGTAKPRYIRIVQILDPNDNDITLATNSANKQLTSPTAFTPTSEGIYTLKISVTDENGNNTYRFVSIAAR